MDPQAVFDELIGACRMLKLVVRNGPMKVPATRLAGGLVRLRGAPVVIVDSSAPVIDRIAAVADAICELEIDPIHLSPDARRALASARDRRKRAKKRQPYSHKETKSVWKVSQLIRQVPGLQRCDPKDSD